MTDDDYPTLEIRCYHEGTRRAGRSFLRIADVVAPPQIPGTAKTLEVKHFGKHEPEMPARTRWTHAEIAADRDRLHSTHRFVCERCGADRPVRAETLYDIVVSLHNMGVFWQSLAQLAATLQDKR